MNYDLKPLFRDEVKEIAVEVTIDPRKVDTLSSEPLCGKIKVSGCFSKTFGTVMLKAEIGCQYFVPCDRCAAQMTKEYRIKIFEKISDKPLQSEDNDYILAENSLIDITELVVSLVLLSKPSKFLCNSDCKGLCQSCGKNLNEGSCDCDVLKTDPRWEKLKELLK